MLKIQKAGVINVENSLKNWKHFDDKKNKEVWGYDVSVEKTLICRPNKNITESSLIRYEDTYYKITKLRKCKNTTIDNWDAYYKIALSKNEQQNIKIIL